MAFTKIVSPGIDTTGSYIVQELNTVGVVTAATVQVGSATTVHTTGIDLGSGNITSHNINSTGIITATSFVGPVTGNITGDITATSGTFSGNVSIAGTLTYEDVTNVDSIGIVTAQSGVHIDDSIVHIGDTDTKIRFPAANTITAETDGTEKLRITSAGKVGIGTNNPTGALTISKEGGATFTLQRDDTSTASNRTLGEIVFRGNDNSGSYEDCAKIRAMSDKGHSDGDKPTRLEFFTTPDNTATLVERLRITSEGLVGIGTDDPSVNDGTGLHIAGTSAGIKLQNLNNNDWAYIEYADESNTTKYIQGYRDASGLYAIRPGTSLNATPGISLDSSGKLGVGAVPAAWHTAASSSVIQVGSSVLFDFSSAQFDVGHNYYYDGSNYKFTTTGYAARMTFSKSDGSIRFWSLGTGNADANATVSEKMRISSAGNIGIGLIDPGTKLEVSGGQNQTANQFVDLFRIAANANNDSLDAEMQLNFGISASHTSTANRRARIQAITHAGTARELSLNPDGGYVGVGTDDPGTALHLLAADTYFTMQSSSASGNAGILFKDSSGTQNGVIFYDFDDDYLKFSTNDDTEALRINSAGNVTIGGKSYPAWNSTVDALTVGYAGVLYEDSYPVAGVAGRDNYVILGNNIYYSASGGNRYIRNDEAQRIMMQGGSWWFQNATAGTAGNAISFADRLHIASTGQVIVGGTANLAHPNMDDIIVGDSTGNRGITICSGTSAYGSVCFGDSADGSGNDRYEGYVEYYHDDNSLRLGTAHTEKVHIKSNGDIRMGTSTFGAAKCKLDIIEDQTIPYGITTVGSIDFVGIMVRTRYYCEFTVEFPSHSTDTSITVKFSRSSNAPSISVDYFTGGGYQVDHGATGNAYISFLSANGNTLYTGTNHQAAYGSATPSWSHGGGTTDVIFKLSNLAYSNGSVCHFKINIPRGGIDNITVDRTTP